MRFECFGIDCESERGLVCTIQRRPFQVLNLYCVSKTSNWVFRPRDESGKATYAYFEVLTPATVQPVLDNALGGERQQRFGN
jgi:hypothetical protein